MSFWSSWVASTAILLISSCFFIRSCAKIASACVSAGLAASFGKESGICVNCMSVAYLSSHRPNSTSSILLTPFGSCGVFGTMPPYMRKRKKINIETILSVVFTLVVLHQIVNEPDEVLIAALQVERTHEFIHRVLSRLHIILTSHINLNRSSETVQLASILLDRAFVLEDHFSAIMEGHNRSQHRLQLGFRELRKATSKCLIKGFGK